MSAGSPAITEPVTVITDFLLAALSVHFALHLWNQMPARRFARWWSVAFALLAASAVCAGIFHGLHGSLPRWTHELFWRSSLALAGLSSFATMRAGALQWLSDNHASGWTKVAAVKLAVSLAVGFLRPLFLVVVIDFGLSILFLLGAGAAGRARNQRGFRALAAAAGVFVAGAAVQQFQVSLHESFNHNDLFHVIQIVGNFLFFLSARQGSSREEPASR